MCESGSSSVVECFLAKEDVAGSTPVSRSKESPVCVTLLLQFSGQKYESPPEARYPSGKGEVCKTFMRRFDPDPRLPSAFVDFRDRQRGQGEVVGQEYKPPVVLGVVVRDPT